MRKRNVFDPKSKEPYELSRTRLERFIECPRCFYLDRRLGIDRPSIPGYTLNSAVDTLFKKEFDLHRAEGTPHSLMTEYGIDAVPYRHEKLEEWRNNFRGIRYLHQPTNLLLFGAIDDIWIKPDGVLLIVDYKSTSTAEEISLDDKYKESYKRQMEIYQWLFRRNGFNIDKTGYFVYANAQKGKEAFHKKLEFEISIIPYLADDSWIEGAMKDAHSCLRSDSLPESNPDCEYCSYRKAAAAING